MKRSGDFCQDVKACLGSDLSIIFDVGANVGTTAQLFSSTFESSVVLSFEPVEGTYRELVANTTELKGVRCFNIGLSDKPAVHEVHAARRSSWNSIDKGVDYGLGKVQMRVDTIDAFCQSHSIETIDLLKTDTEGHDLSVLRGANRMFDSGKIRAVYSEVGFYANDRGHAYFCDVLRFLQNKHFQIFDFYHVLSHYIENREHSDYPWSNVLFIRNDIIDSLCRPHYLRWLKEEGIV
jgi:FkbM family methyltransferase